MMLCALAFFMCAGYTVHAQSKTVSGTVSDETGNGLQGASVAVQGTTVGTLTGADGSFSLEVPGNDAVLVISYVGYERQEITVGTNSNFTITMKEDVSLLDEVVVVGYGTQKKRDVTGAISTIDGEKIGKIPVASSVQSMQGQVAGVDIQSAGGRPGQAPTIAQPRPNIVPPSIYLK